MTLPAVYPCPAKVNLTLSVGPPRAADGMHPICSWMVRVSLYDDLTIVPRTDAASSYDIAFADDAPQPSPIDWPVESDLAVRAHRLIERHVGRELPVQMVVRKRIPVGAGLAGGSSNAATMMIALNETFDLGLTRDTLAELSGQLGSDIAFFFGPPSAVISGVGDVIEPGPEYHTRRDLVLLLPPLSCNTGAVYRQYDAQIAGRDIAVEDYRYCTQPSGNAHDFMMQAFNDLQEPAFDVEPRLREIESKCVELLDTYPQVTGSGAAMFIVCDTGPDAQRIASQISESLSIPTRAVHTL